MVAYATHHAFDCAALRIHTAVSVGLHPLLAFDNDMISGGAPHAAAAGEVPHGGPDFRRPDYVLGLLFHERGEWSFASRWVWLLTACGLSSTYIF